MGSTHQITKMGIALASTFLVLTFLFPTSAFATDPPATPPAQPGTPGNSNNLSTALNCAGALIPVVGSFLATNCAVGVATGSNPLQGAGEVVGQAVSAVSDFTLGAIFKWVAITILTIVNWLLIATSFLFNLVMVHLVFHFATVVGGSAGLHLAWGILRDIGNILLLFGFIFMGIGTILNLHHFNAKTALPSLIIFTVLLNFSLFAASAVIDSANLLSATFYNQVGGQSCDGQGARDCVNIGISTRILAMSGINTENAVPNTTNAAGMSNTDTAIAYLGLALFNVVAAFVIGAGAIMLAIRAITLTFLMVLSPIGFAGMAIPLLHTQANDWWKRLIDQSFFAPVYILLIFVSLKIMESMSAAIGTQGQSLLGAFVLSRPETVGIIVIYVLTIGFMIGSLMVAKSMGAYGADFATSTSARMTTWPFGVIGRNTVGRFANRLEHGVNETSLFGKERKAFYKSIAGSSMALRDIPGVASVTGLNLGKTGAGADHGFHGVEEAEKKRLVAASKNIGAHDQEEADKIKYALWQIDRDINNVRLATTQEARADADSLGLTGDTYRDHVKNYVKNALDSNPEFKALEDTKTNQQVRLANIESGIQNAREDFANKLGSFPNSVLPGYSSAKGEVLKDLRTPRSEKNLASLLAQRSSDGGNPGGGGGGACWVAREVYGENNPKWREFRSWLLSEAPTWLRDTYLTHGERFAERIKNKPLLKNGIRVMMDLAIQHRRERLLPVSA